MGRKLTGITNQINAVESIPHTLVRSVRASVLDMGSVLMSGNKGQLIATACVEPLQVPV